MALSVRRLIKDKVLRPAAETAKVNLDSIFRTVKAQSFQALAATPIAQETKRAEIRRMAPAIVAGLVGLVIVVYVLARRK